MKCLLNRKIFILGIVLFGVFSLATQAYAAQLYFETPAQEVGVGQRFKVSIYVHSEGETVNAFGGTVHIPLFLTPISINDGNSIVALWSKRPEIESNEIMFAGIVPSGWNGNKGFLFSFIAEANLSGNEDIGLTDTLVLLHDGKGTSASLSVESLSFSANSDTLLVEFEEMTDDKEPPEVFTLEVWYDIGLFSGDAFLVFTAQDKGSGIDHYEILETQKKLRDETKDSWEYAESPYRLHDQSLKSFVYVRAVDRTGNVRVSVYEPEDPKATSASLAFIVLALILFLILGLFFLRKKHL